MLFFLLIIVHVHRLLGIMNMQNKYVRNLYVQNALNSDDVTPFFSLSLFYSCICPTQPRCSHCYTEYNFMCLDEVWSKYVPWPMGLLSHKADEWGSLGRVDVWYQWIYLRCFCYSEDWFNDFIHIYCWCLVLIQYPVNRNFRTVWMKASTFICRR